VTKTNITLKPAAGLTPKQAHDARARAWAFVFQCWQERQKAAPASRPNDAEGGLNDIRANAILPKES
jgi:hypothetical protein